MSYIFQPEAIPSVPIAGSDQVFPVRRIYCVGQNYGDHVREMGGDPKQNPPVFFSKPANAVVTNNQAVRYPSATDNLHYEAELVVALGSGGGNIDAAQALDCVFGYAIGIDFTRRDLQAAAKQSGKPWDAAKGFDESAPLSAIAPADHIDPQSGRIWLSVNGEVRQDADLSDMIWSVPEIIAQLSTLYTLKAGDLIFTGTPAGVSAVIPGDRIKAGIADVGEIEFELIAADNS
ncbi:MAG: fumarylacetoacetate hydrolase family protein [Pseudomonadales bacterium]|nr:fumarylacetoacetate hydrolase family protein [Pseudomonadales bacterium]